LDLPARKPRGLLIQASQSWLKIRHWLNNGGDATLKSYGSKTGSMLDVSLVEPAHVDWLKALPLFHRDQHRVYVHAGLEEGIPLDQQSKHTAIWKRYPSDSQEDTVISISSTVMIPSTMDLCCYRTELI
jgi:hypothetical protein